MSKLSVITGVVTNRAKVFETDHPTHGGIEATGSAGKFYKITIADRTFNAPVSFGKKIHSGQNLVVVLHKDEIIMMRDIESGQIFGTLGPWISISLFVIITLFNTLMLPVYMDSPSTRNFSLLLGVNLFLIVLLIIAMVSYSNERKALAIMNEYHP